MRVTDARARAVGKWIERWRRYSLAGGYEAMMNKIETVGFWIELPLVLVVTSFWGLVIYETVMMLEHPVLYNISFVLLTVLWLCCLLILHRSYKRNFKR